MARPAIPVIVTRAQPGADETAQRVQQMGLCAIVSPVLAQQDRPEAGLPDAETLSGLVFTSANGVRAYSARQPGRMLPAWCVGPATAAAARQAGFALVHESAGNAADLAAFIASNTAPTAKPLLHVANAAAKGDLKELLADHGFETVFAPLYDMRPAATLSEAARETLTGNAPCLVLIHSAKGAQRFADLCAGIRPKHLTAAVISDAAAKPLNVLDLRAIHTAPRPNEEGLFQALGTALATLSA